MEIILCITYTAARLLAKMVNERPHAEQDLFLRLFMQYRGDIRYYIESSCISILCFIAPTQFQRDTYRPVL